MTQNFKADDKIREIAEAYALDAIDYGNEYGVSFDWSDKSIRYTEQVLGDLHNQIAEAQPSEEQISTFAKMFGSYVGEVFRKNHGGEWGMVEMSGNSFPGMRSEKDGGLFWPWGKVQNRIISGPEDNVHDYYKYLVGMYGNTDGNKSRSFWGRLFRKH